MACLPFTIEESNLSSSSTDEEPLVNTWVDWCRGETLVCWDRRELVEVNTSWGLLDGQVGTTIVSMGYKVRLMETYTETSPGWVLPVTSFSQASAHSRTMSVAYLLNVSNATLNSQKNATHFRFLHSPVKANWFSGFPSGIL